MCQCKDTYEDLLFKRLCSDPIQVQCGTGLGETQPHCSVLQHNIWQEAFPPAQCCSTHQAASSLVPLQIHIRTFALHTSEQSPNTNALQHKIWQTAFPTAQCRSANRADSSFVPLRHLLSIQACRHPTPMHCSKGFGKKHSLLLSAALQTRLTAALCHCRYTYGHFLSIKACRYRTPMHCSTGTGKKHFHAAQCCSATRLTAALCHCRHTYGHLLVIQMCSHPTPMHCCTAQAKSTPQC